MNRLKMLLIAAALMTGGSALASAQPRDHDDRDRDRYRNEDHDRGRDHDRDDRRYRFDRDDHHYVDREHFRSFRREDDGPPFRDRDEVRFYVGQRRYINGFYWTWDGERWCRYHDGLRIYLSF